jgi:hypothetical protein
MKLMPSRTVKERVKVGVKVYRSIRRHQAENFVGFGGYAHLTHTTILYCPKQSLIVVHDEKILIRLS